MFVRVPHKRSGSFPVRFFLLSLLFAFVLASGFFLFMEVGRGMTYYYEVDEVTPETAPRNFKLSGKVDPGSIVRDPAKGTLSFVLAGGVHKYPVVYKGVVPDIFRDGIQVVVEGGFTPDGSFSAHSLLAKCPSKYIPKGKAEDFITPLYP